MRGALSYRAGQAVAQLGMSLLGSSYPIEDEPLEPTVGVCTMILEWGLPSSEHRQTGGSLIGDDLSDDSCPIRDEL